MNTLIPLLRFISHSWAMTCLLAVIWSSLPCDAVAQSRSQVGVLVCSGEGNWNTTIKSLKQFECTFSSANGMERCKYAADILAFDFSASVSPLGDSALIWQVFAPPDMSGENYQPGDLEDVYVNAGIKSPKSTEFKAGSLIGRGPISFVLQPVSIQVETGFSIAADVNIFLLTYIGPQLAEESGIRK